MIAGQDSQLSAAASFRDPGGVLVLHRGAPIRFVREDAKRTLSAFLDSSLAREWVDQRRMVWTAPVNPPDLSELASDRTIGALAAREPWGAVVRHEPIPFPSFPFEWTPGMLWAAADLTLSLAQDLLRDGRGLKDATPFNVLFRGAAPVFVDLLSIEDRSPTDPVWLPYAQFVRTFLVPLIVHRTQGYPVRYSYLVGEEGLEPEAAFRMLSVRNRLRLPALTSITLPVLLSRVLAGAPTTAEHPAPARAALPLVDEEKARYLLAALFDRLRRSLGRVHPRSGHRSRWTAYSAEHPAAYFDVKRELVAEVTRRYVPKMALDIGCNSGDLSETLANAGASVVAIDSDTEVVEGLWARAHAKHLDILPLVVDIADPTPARGWGNRERSSFLERATGRFDVVLALAVVHHLLVTSAIPLDSIVELFARLTRHVVVVEFVPPSDPHFRQLARGRDSLHAGLDRAAFELAFAKRFHIARSVSLPVPGRIAYVLEKR